MRIALNVAMTLRPLLLARAPKDLVTRHAYERKGARHAQRGSGRLRGHAHDRLLHDRQVDERRGDAEEHREPPHHVIGAGALEQVAPEQDAEETADLMAEEGEAEQH